jgi:hypothetical protein
VGSLLLMAIEAPLSQTLTGNLVLLFLFL